MKRQQKCNLIRVFFFLLLLVYCSFVVLVQHTETAPHVLPSKAEFMGGSTNTMEDISTPKRKIISSPFAEGGMVGKEPIRNVPNSLFALARKNESLLDTKNASQSFPIPQNWSVSLVEGNVAAFQGKNLWEHTQLPRWMKDYFSWHKQKVAKLNGDRSNAWKDTLFYLVECSAKFEHCGGTADRLGPLPYHIRMAANSQRLLLFSWRDNKPAPLETFLLPPIGGIDWRMHDWLLDQFEQDGEASKKFATSPQVTTRLSQTRQVRWLRVKFQSHDHGCALYDSSRVDENDPTFAQVFHDVWRVAFTPVPEIAQRIEEQMQSLGLLPGHYVSTHLRALYQENRSYDDTEIAGLTQLMLRCATTKLPLYYVPGETQSTMPILFVSDSPKGIQAAKDFGYDFSIRIEARTDGGQQPLHLEKDIAANVKDYFDTFVDLYLMGMGRCTAYSFGGYGRLGSMISYDSSCYFHVVAVPEKCEFSARGRRQEPGREEPKPAVPLPLFFPPMESLDPSRESLAGAPKDLESDVIGLSAKAFNYSKLSYTLDDSILDDPFLYDEFDTEKYGVNLWERSKKIPTWMKRYFKWHKKQRHHNLNPEKWKSIRLLVMECQRSQNRCGGTSDRLKPFLSLVRMAATSKRLLLIHWTRPSRLEEFLLPPKGGVDWRVPAWLHPLLTNYGESYSQVDDVRDEVASSSIGVRTKYQSFDGGQGWYDSMLEANETSFNEVFHDVWRVFFTPSPPVAKIIKEEMVRKGLAPGEYASAHLRALYAQEHRAAKQTIAWTKLSVNCASKLRPGKPIFFSSDSKVASIHSVEYGASMNGTVVTHQNNPDPPLHLDKAENFSDPTLQTFRPVSDYYDTFVDLYLLALGQCVYLSKGGFGHWGLLIGGNITCAGRLKKTTRGFRDPCNWTVASDGSTATRVELKEPLFLEPKVFLPEGNV
eukprot:Nitzschia sp. Nitz4//scaffold113_size70149//2348//5307//NITZ4_005938-RA/size70149-augustus-gene-0.123-mRNA-1//-1//CDS//3329533305//2730//frame0